MVKKSKKIIDLTKKKKQRLMKSFCEDLKRSIKTITIKKELK
jgi:hypothetical protein